MCEGKGECGATEKNTGGAEGLVMRESRVIHGRDLTSEDFVPDVRFKPVIRNNKPPAEGTNII